MKEVYILIDTDDITDYTEILGAYSTKEGAKEAYNKYLDTIYDGEEEDSGMRIECWKVKE